MLSNGTLLRPGVAARLASYRNLLGVSISVYGATPEVHDGVTQIRGSWRRTLDGAERLRAQGVAVRLKLIVMRPNVHEVGAMRALCDARGFPYLLNLTVTARHDGTQGSLAMRITEAELAALYRGPLRNLIPNGNRTVDEAAFPCNCARGNAAISARGDVFPCVSVPWTAGNIRQQPFGEIWRSSPVFERIRGLKIADYPACAPCPDKSFCSRDRGAAYNASGSYTGTDPFVCAAAGVARAVAGESSTRPRARRSASAGGRHSALSPLSCRRTVVKFIVRCPPCRRSSPSWRSNRRWRGPRSASTACASPGAPGRRFCSGSRRADARSRHRASGGDHQLRPLLDRPVLQRVPLARRRRRTLGFYFNIADRTRIAEAELEWRRSILDLLATPDGRLSSSTRMSFLPSSSQRRRRTSPRERQRSSARRPP